MKKRDSFFNKLYDEAGDIEFSLRNDADDVSDESLEKRYKIVVLTILPILLSRVRAIFFILAFLAGGLLARIF